MKQIVFARADRFILVEDYRDVAPFKPPHDIITSYGEFLVTGDYTIRRSFLFEANWPAVNTLNTRRAACVHDFFYSLIADNKLSIEYRVMADSLLRDILIQDGIFPARAIYWYEAVRFGGEDAIKAKKDKLYAPQLPTTQIQPDMGKAKNDQIN